MIASPSPAHRIFFRRLIIWISGVVLFLFMAGIVISVLYGDKIKEGIIYALNENLNVKVEVSEMDFSIFSHFPFASVTLINIKVHEPEQFESGELLLHAERFSLLFNVFDVMRGKYILQKTEIKSGELQIRYNENGDGNFKVWKNDTTLSNHVNLDLENILLSRVNVRYVHSKNSREYFFLIDESRMRVSMDDETISIHANADLIIEKLLSDKIPLISQKKSTVRLNLTVQNETGTYSFSDSRITVSGLDLLLNGTLVEGDNFSDYDLTIKSDHADLISLLSVIPHKFIDNLSEFNFRGNAFFEMSIRGRAGKNSAPEIKAAFGTRNSMMKPVGNEIKLEQIHFAGNYISRNKKSGRNDVLEIKDIKASLNGKAISGYVKIENLKDPVMHIEASATADLAMLSRFFKPEIIDFMRGDIEFRNAKFSGTLSNLKTYASSGSIVWKNGMLKLTAKPTVISNIEANLAMQKNQLKINLLSGNTSQSDFSFSGDLKNFFGYFFRKNEILSVDAAFQSSNLNLNEILEKDKSTSRNDTIYKIRFADDISFVLRTSVDRIVFNKFEAGEVRGDVSMKNRILKADQLQFKSMEGSVLLAGTMQQLSNDSLLIKCNASINKVNTTELFYEMGNFNQQIITDKHLRGSVSAEINMNSKWSTTLQCNAQTLYADAVITIENGELINFTPMLALSKYVKGADLNDIKFSTLSNRIEIKNRQVLIPQMEINSTAMNLILSGTHSFDNIIDYHLQLLLSQLLGRKVKNLNTEFGTIGEDNLGKTRIFISMKGDASNPKFAYDSKGAKEKIASDIKKEKETLKEILKEEFGKKKDVASSGKESGKKEELQIEKEEESN